MRLRISFDIDRTLMAGTQFHREAMQEAMTEVYGVNVILEDARCAGGVDKQIVRDALSDEVDPSEFDRKWDEFSSLAVKLSGEKIASNPPVLLPGAEELVRQLFQEGHVLGIASGNLEGIARAKLRFFNLEDCMSFYGSGCRFDHRNDLLAHGHEEARKIAPEARFGFHFGDTPNDIEAALHSRVFALGVGTGRHSTRELVEIGAHSVFPTLANTGMILHAIRLWVQRGYPA